MKKSYVMMKTSFNKSNISKGCEQDSGFQKLTGSWRHRLRAPDRGEN